MSTPRKWMHAAVEFKAWASMKRRCYSPSHHRYEYYGARGIVVCARWLESFENFFADMGKRPSPKHSLDRINNDGNYEPSNCRWATATEQQRNRRFSTLTAEDVVEIRAAAAAGAHQRDLAKRFGTAQSNIHSVIARLTWKDAP